MTVLNRIISHHRADTIMSGIVFVWGFHFIVLKDGLNDIAPLTYNALRFAVGLPLITLFTLRDRATLHLSRRDLALIAGVTVVGPLGYQILFILGLDLTTSTNTALLIATMPTWTAVISIMIGMVRVHRRLLVGIAITLCGVVLVVVNRAGAELSLSRDDLIGSTLALSAALVAAIGTIYKKPILDRLGGQPVTLWSYWMTTLGLVIIAAPDLLTFSADTVPADKIPNVLYSGLLSSVGGFWAMNYAIQQIGPTRANSYHNITPIIATLAGVIVLGDPLTTGLLIGGGMTLVGVMMVRRNTFLRPLSQPVSQESPTAPAIPTGAVGAHQPGDR